MLDLYDKLPGSSQCRRMTGLSGINTNTILAQLVFMPQPQLKGQAY